MATEIIQAEDKYVEDAASKVMMQRLILIEQSAREIKLTFSDGSLLCISANGYTPEPQLDICLNETSNAKINPKETNRDVQVAARYVNDFYDTGFFGRRANNADISKRQENIDFVLKGMRGKLGEDDMRRVHICVVTDVIGLEDNATWTAAETGELLKYFGFDRADMKAALKKVGLYTETEHGSATDYYKRWRSE